MVKFVRQHKQNTQDQHLKTAAAAYNKAVEIYPFIGKFHFLYATLVNMFRDTFGASNSLLKAYMCSIPSECKEDL